jgi:hypothetical protein
MPRIKFPKNQSYNFWQTHQSGRLAYGHYSTSLNLSLVGPLRPSCSISWAFTAKKESLLGLRKDQGYYLAFQAATAVYRKWGFRSFLTLCWLVLRYVASFLVSAYQRTTEEDRVGQAILVASVLLTLFGAFHIQIVLNFVGRTKNYVLRERQNRRKGFVLYSSVNFAL